MTTKFIASICISIILSVLPFIIIFFISGGNYPKLPVQIVHDSLYYYARATDVSKGNIFIGNPYIKENKAEISPYFFVADWLWAIPLILGFSIQTSIIINQVFWFLVFGIFLFYLFKFFDLDEKYIPWAIAFVTLYVYWYLARPVAVQVVYPVFLLWLLSFAFYLKNPQSRKYIIFLALSTALSICTYPYLTQIILFFFFAVLVASFFQPFKRYSSLWFSAVLAGFLSIPFLIYVWKQIHNPFYFETISRISLVQTHTIGMLAVFYSMLILLSLLVLYLLREKFSNVQLYLISLFSFGLLVATLSNVLTGQDPEIAIHTGMFVNLWSAIMFCVFVQKSLHKHWVFGIYKHWFFGLYTVIIIYTFFFWLLGWWWKNETLLSKEVYNEPLSWLNANIPKESIIFADDSFSEFVPVLTDDYVLFAPHAILQTDSNKAMQDRYLASRIFQSLSLRDIKNDMPAYAGSGYSYDRYMIYNRGVKVCKSLHLDLFGRDCGRLESRDSFISEKYFSDMKSQYEILKKEPLKTLQKYRVSYIVTDKQNKWVIPKSLKSLWSNDRFEIFKVES